MFCIYYCFVFFACFYDIHFQEGRLPCAWKQQHNLPLKATLWRQCEQWTHKYTNRNDEAVCIQACVLSLKSRKSDTSDGGKADIFHIHVSVQVITTSWNICVCICKNSFITNICFIVCVNFAKYKCLAKNSFLFLDSHRLANSYIQCISE